MATKKEFIAQQVAKAVGAGKAVAMETVDFNDPNRPKTCLEVDFPILPVNQVAVIEGNAGKPIYQMSKWWARRRSSVFRSMLIAAATKAPEDHSQAAKLVWDNYYANHQKKGAFKHLKVADIFMGGGTTLVEGSRLGMQMSGNDLNPVAWFVVKQELADVDLDEVKRLLADIEAEVKPQIMPFYYCDGPNGEKGTWIHKPSGKVMGADFAPLSLKPEERKDYSYEGPEIIYTFWAKHGPCQVTGCGHRTPIMTSPVMAVKTLTVKHWEHVCAECKAEFDIEDAEARMAPDAPLYVSPDEKPYAVLDAKGRVKCPKCEHIAMVKLGKGANKKINLTLLVHPDWLRGESKTDAAGKEYGGSAQDDAASTTAWNLKRAETIRLLEVRGSLPDIVTCPETGAVITTGTKGGTVPKKSNFTCASCGSSQDVLDAVRATKKTGPNASFAFHGFSSVLAASGASYGGRFFSPFGDLASKQHSAAVAEWQTRSKLDLADFWPREPLSEGWKTHGWGIPDHGFTHYWTMFNARQLLVLSQILKAITGQEGYSTGTREYVLGAFQSYLRNQNMFCFWDKDYDKLVPHLSNNNYHPKSLPVENSGFAPMGRGSWLSCAEGIVEGKEWHDGPWDSVSSEQIKSLLPELHKSFKAKSQKVYVGDVCLSADVYQASSTDLSMYETNSTDLVVTDPPFGEIMQYAELADFFYVWMKPFLAKHYPEIFGQKYSPKSLEVVSNPYREPNNPDEKYKLLLTNCWREAHRILRPGGILTFTFHHDKDSAWASVLESLFESGFYLEATFPTRSDETKGDGQFGSQKIEYDIIHVCRKRTEEPKPVSWGRMRREVLADVKQLQAMLENHSRAGLPAADLQVIRRGKALEYFSRHYGKVYVDDGRPISVKDALVGINQLIDEDSNKAKDPPPVIAEPITRQFLRIFQGTTEVARDQMQKLLRGSGIAPDEFENRNWAKEKSKVFHAVDPLDFARDWHGKHRRRLTADLDQALVLIGACYDGSGINAADTLKNENFKPHAALKSLLDWIGMQGATHAIRNAALRARSIYNAWAETNRNAVAQMSLFQEDAA